MHHPLDCFIPIQFRQLYVEAIYVFGEASVTQWRKGILDAGSGLYSDWMEVIVETSILTFQKSASSVLDLLLCLRTSCTLRSPTILRPCWTAFLNSLMRGR